MPMKRYVVDCEYMVRKDMTVLVEDGKSPMDPSNWVEVVDEHDTDCSLWNTLYWKEDDE